MRKHQQKNGSKKRRWFPRRKPHGMTDAQVVGTMSAIDKRERHEKRVEIRRLKQGMEAMEREQYHELRLRDMNRQHDSTMAHQPASPV